MTRIEKTIIRDSLTVRVAISRTVAKDVAYADGWNVDLGDKAVEHIEIWLEKGGKKSFTRGLGLAYELDAAACERLNLPAGTARFGDNYISAAAWAQVQETLAAAQAEADAATDPAGDYARIKQQQDDAGARMAAELAETDALEQERERHPGWCKKCHSYCWGDCSAS